MVELVDQIWPGAGRARITFISKKRDAFCNWVCLSVWAYKLKREGA